MVLCASKCTSNARLDGKTAVITGCNTGIGKVTVLDFYRRGCRVIMACRSTEKAEAAKEEIIEQLKGKENLGEIIVKSLDLSSCKSIRECAQELLDEEPRIDILLNNAGVMMCPKSYTEDGFEMQFGTNHLGHFLFTLLLLPRIIRSAPARIVNVSSKAYTWGPIDLEDLNWKNKSYSAAAAYGQSKLANILFTKELAKRLEGTNVHTYCLHPGVVDTEVTRHFDNALFPGSQFLMKTVGKVATKTPEQGAQTSIYCSLDEKSANETGLYYADCKVACLSDQAKDMDMAKKLWDESVKLVKLEGFDPFNAQDNGPKVK